MSKATDYTFHVVIIRSDPCRTKTCLNERSKHSQERIIFFSRSSQNPERIIFRLNTFSYVLRKVNFFPAYVMIICSKPV